MTQLLSVDQVRRRARQGNVPDSDRLGSTAETKPVDANGAAKWIEPDEMHKKIPPTMTGHSLSLT